MTRRLDNLAGFNPVPDFCRFPGFHMSEEGHSGVEDILKKAHAIREKALGTDHPEVARNLHNLAVHRCVRYEDRQNQAEPLSK